MKKKNIFFTVACLIISFSFSVHSTLTRQEQRTINRTLDTNKNKNEVLVHAFNVKMTREKMLCLKDGTWLNDEVINFYLEILKQQSLFSPSAPECLFFSTFFYFKLVQQSKRFNYESIKKWTKKVDIFLYDKVIIPVHLGSHWALVVVNLKSKLFEYYDSYKPTRELESKELNILKHIERYIKAESLDKKKKEFDTSDFAKIVYQDIPTQENGCDCGVFTLQFAELISQNKPLLFSQQDIPDLRKKICADIVLKGEKFKTKRSELIIDLTEDD